MIIKVFVKIKKMQKRKFFSDEDNRLYKYQQERGNKWRRERERYDYADEDPEDPSDWGFETYPISRYAASKRGGIIDKALDLGFIAIAGPIPWVQDQLVMNAINLDNTGDMVQCINLIQQGMTISQRIGNKITMAKLEVRLQLIADGSGDSTYLGTRARYLIIYDRQPNHAYPVNSVLATNFVGGILSNINQAGTVTPAVAANQSFIYAQLDINSQDRFLVLYDRYIFIPPFVSGAVSTTAFTGPTDNNTFNHVFDLDLKDLETVYSGNVLNGSGSLTIADVMTGALYLVAMSDKAATDLSWSLTGNMRLWFHDN